MRRILILATVAAAGLVVPGRAPALTFLELATGDEALSPDARSAAMGRTRVAEESGPFTGTENPALLAWSDEHRVALSGAVLKLKESRSFPAFDSFDGFLVESIYALNDKYQYDGGVGASASLGTDWIPGGLGVGVSWSPVRDYQYDYSEEVRDNNPFTQPRDKLIARNDVQSDGMLGAWTFAVGASPHEKVALGISVQRLSGKQDLLRRILFVQAGTSETALVETESLSGERLIAGLAIRPDHRVDISVSWKSETTLEGTFTREGSAEDVTYFAGPANPDVSSGGLEIKYPNEVAVGVAYRPRAKVRTTFRVEAGWTEWSAFEHDLYDRLDLSDVWNVRIGLEHVFYNGFPVRFGFHYQPSPQDEEVTTTAFTFGGGIELGPLHTDLGFEVANREYRFPDLFDDAMFGGNTRTEKDFVEESGLSAFATVSWAVAGLGGGLR